MTTLNSNATVITANKLKSKTNGINKYFYDEDKPEDDNYALDEFKEATRPFKYFISIPGKAGNLQMVDAVNQFIEIPQDKLEIIEQIRFNLMNVCLILDDIQDSSGLRRGVPTAHKIFGFSKTVLAVDYIFQRTMGLVLELEHPKAMDIYMDLVFRMWEGQGKDVYYRDNFICPTEEEYVEICFGKTGGMVVGILRLLGLFCDLSRLDEEVFAKHFSLNFQINNDYQGLIRQDYFTSKGYCEDITEGKCSFPIVHAVNTHPEEGKIIMDILRKRTTDIELKKYCVSLIEKCGSFEYTRQKMKEIGEAFRREIKILSDLPALEAFIYTFESASI